MSNTRSNVKTVIEQFQRLGSELFSCRNGFNEMRNYNRAYFTSSYRHPQEFPLLIQLII